MLTSSASRFLKSTRETVVASGTRLRSPPSLGGASRALSGAAALVETMVCIEHGMWSKRFEGDIRDGWGGEAGENWAVTDHITPCHKFNSVTGALDWIVKNGVADPDCYRYVGAPLRSHRGPRRPHHARR